MPTVVIAAITTSIRPGSPVSVVLPAGRPLAEQGSILAFQVMTAAQDRLVQFLGMLDRNQIADLDTALAVAFGLPLAEQPR